MMAYDYQRKFGGPCQAFAPHFLLGSVMLFLIGAISAGRTFEASGGMVSANSAAIMVQLAGQLANEYFDREGDIPSRRSLFAGGSG